MHLLPAPELVSVNIPFSGFYESLWSGLVDHEAQQWLEHVVEEPDRYSPAEVLCAKKGHLGELLADKTQYSVAYAKIAKDYAEAYFWWLGESLGFPVHRTAHVRGSASAPWTHYTYSHPVAWQWEEMTSPRQYNFETDRLFAKVDAVVLRELFRKLMLVDNSWAFDRTVREMFTSYSGFCSFYDNDPEVLKAKPLEDWDHNELTVLLIAWQVLQFKFGRGSSHCGNLEDHIYDDLSSDGYSYFDDAVDWGALEESCRIKVLDLLDEDDLTDAEVYQLEHPRCPDTLELPL